LDRRSFLAAATAVAGGSLIPSVSRSAQVANVRFDDDLTTSAGRLRLLGTGLYYYKYFIKAAAAGLYLDDRASGGEVLADVAKRLEMQYFWAVKASDLVAGSSALLARNLSTSKRAAVQPQIDQMHALYQDVAAGDRSALMYVPGEGTSLLLNGKPLGIVPGSEFASAYFSIWFGEQPLDAGLKKKLLGL
jgi:hypothetical protein